MQIVINPGSGPVADADEAVATENIRHFLTDLTPSDERDPQWVRIPTKDDRGRFAFLLWRENHCTLVEMPGIPLNRVRFVQDAGLDPWEFPRLYVDRASWLWCFALNCARRELWPQTDKEDA